MITGKEEVVVGTLIRSQFRRILDREKNRQIIIDIEYTESKGWLDSSFFIEVTGDREEVEAWFDTLHGFINDIR